MPSQQFPYLSASRVTGSQGYPLSEDRLLQARAPLASSAAGPIWLRDSSRMPTRQLAASLANLSAEAEMVSNSATNMATEWHKFKADIAASAAASTLNLTGPVRGWPRHLDLARNRLHSDSVNSLTVGSLTGLSLFNQPLIGGRTPLPSGLGYTSAYETDRELDDLEGRGLLPSKHRQNPFGHSTLIGSQPTASLGSMVFSSRESERNGIYGEEYDDNKDYDGEDQGPAGRAQTLFADIGSNFNKNNIVNIKMIREPKYGFGIILVDGEVSGQN
ncbi:unnamed protein product [Protopolystoma xenopodis]|uniref:Uncharacterized protein n=1 Tax=Protopolystoma xenopodis TaxID=117903 RepID=A0A3S5FF09_9PLAT|nr:unnamed protein product [Protopolystoma xenopodis]